MKIDGSILEEQSFFMMLGLYFACKLDWGSYIIFIAKAASKKIEALICSMKYLSFEVTVHLYKCTLWSCLEYCCHVLSSAPSWYLKCQIDYKKKYVGLLVLHLLSFLEHLAHCQNIASVYLLVITLLDVHLNWLNWFHFSILERDLFVILIDCTNFLSPFLDVMSISMSPDSFLHSQTLEFSANRMFF